MEARKNSKYDLAQYKRLFFNIGLVVSLLFVIAAFEWKFYDKQDILKQGTTTLSFEHTVEIPPTKQPPPPPPKFKNFEIVAIQDNEEIIEEIQINIDVEVTQEMAVEVLPELVVIEPEEKEEVDEIFLIVEEDAKPVDGMNSFYNFINNNIKYPREAEILNIEGKVYVEFVVEKDGSISNVQIVRGIGAGCDKEAVRVLKLTPKWIPAKQRGRAVRVKMIIPIFFKLEM